tara:strand:- start:154 stop:582 length:429 start_codon:yes stop_codon:yes gene_type:complete
MNKATFKSIQTFFRNEQNIRGNIFTGESMTTAKSFAKGAVIGILGGRFTAERTFNDELKNKIRDNYVRRMCKEEVREISKSDMIEYLNQENATLEKNDKTFWKAGNVMHIKMYQRAKSYYDALLLFVNLSDDEKYAINTYGK